MTRGSSARDDIFARWQEATDPRNLQPDVRPLFRAAAAHVRRYPPPHLGREEVDRACEALEAPWGVRIEKALREVFTAGDEGADRTSVAIIERVKTLGLQPWKAPDPLPPIEEEDIVLVVWMAVEAEGRAS